MITKSAQTSYLIGDRKSGLENFSYQKGMRVSAVLSPFLTKALTSTTVDYATSEYKLFNTKEINGYIIPELWMGDFIGRTSTSTSLDIRRTGQQMVSTATTGAVSAILRRRFVLDYPLRAGCTVGNFMYRGFGVASAINTLYEAGTNTGATGTVSIQCNFGTMNTSGTLTQIGTMTQTMTITSAAQTVPIVVYDTTTGTTGDGDCIYFEIILTLNQTARTAGANAIGVNYQCGSVVQTVSSPSNIMLYFDIR